MKSSDKLDSLIKQAFDNDEAYEVPRLDDVWDKIEDYMDTKNRKIRIMKRVIGIAASLIIIVISSICFLDDESYANYMRTLKVFVGLEDNSSINIDNRAPGEIETSIEEIVSIDKIKKLASFPIKQLQYIPKDYRYSSSYASKLNGSIISVQSIYISSEEILELTQEPIDKSFAETIKINPNLGTIDKKIINGYNYNIIHYSNGKTEIIWDINEIKYILKGKLDKEEMLKAALSIK